MPLDCSRGLHWDLNPVCPMRPNQNLVGAGCFSVYHHLKWMISKKNLGSLCSAHNRKDAPTNKVENEIKAGYYNIIVKHGRSNIWTDFSFVTVRDGNEQQRLSCNKCAKVLTYDGHKSGATGLQRHTCSVQSKLSFKEKALLSSHIR